MRTNHLEIKKKWEKRDIKTNIPIGEVEYDFSEFLQSRLLYNEALYSKSRYISVGALDEYLGVFKKPATDKNIFTRIIWLSLGLKRASIDFEKEVPNFKLLALKSALLSEGT